MITKVNWIDYRALDARYQTVSNPGTSDPYDIADPNSYYYWLSNMVDVNLGDATKNTSTVRQIGDRTESGGTLKQVAIDLKVDQNHPHVGRSNVYTVMGGTGLGTGFYGYNEYPETFYNGDLQKVIYDLTIQYPIRYMMGSADETLVPYMRPEALEGGIKYLVYLVKNDLGGLTELGNLWNSDNPVDLNSNNALSHWNDQAQTYLNLYSARHAGPLVHEALYLTAGFRKGFAGLGTAAVLRLVHLLAEDSSTHYWAGDFNTHASMMNYFYYPGSGSTSRMQGYIVWGPPSFLTYQVVQQNSRLKYSFLRNRTTYDPFGIATSDLYFSQPSENMIPLTNFKVKVWRTVADWPSDTNPSAIPFNLYDPDNSSRWETQNNWLWTFANNRDYCYTGFDGSSDGRGRTECYFELADPSVIRSGRFYVVGICGYSNTDQDNLIGDQLPDPNNTAPTRWHFTTAFPYSSGFGGGRGYAFES